MHMTTTRQMSEAERRARSAAAAAEKLREEDDRKRILRLETLTGLTHGRAYVASKPGFAFEGRLVCLEDSGGTILATLDGNGCSYTGAAAQLKPLSV